MKNDVLILDGRHLLWRTSDAFSDLGAEINGREIGTGGIYGFLSVGIRIHQRYGGTTAVAWEGSGNFRFKLYPDYKKKLDTSDERMELVEDMNEQELRLKAMLRAMGIEQYYGVGCEADDVIGRLATEAKQKGKSVTIYTGDSDLRQLVTDGITVVAPGRRAKDTIYDRQTVIEKHGVPPELIADQKALAGDKSDNIPGIRGIGPKTAADLVNAFGSADEVVKHAMRVKYKLIDKSHWPVAERFVLPITDGKKNIELYKKLTEIRTNKAMKRIKAKRNQITLLNHIRGYKFRSLMAPAELNALMRMGK